MCILRCPDLSRPNSFSAAATVSQLRQQVEQELILTETELLTCSREYEWSWTLVNVGEIIPWPNQYCKQKICTVGCVCLDNSSRHVDKKNKS